MNVKAQGILNAAAWVRAHHGEDGLQRVLGRCSPAIRDRVATAIAINWAPFDELAGLLQALDRELGAGDGQLAEASARGRRGPRCARPSGSGSRSSSSTGTSW